jgi:hypothetical protein
MAFDLRVHRYAINHQTAERELVEYRPLLRLGCSSPDGYSGEILYLQGGCVYGEGGAAYAPEDLPAWFAGASAAVHPQALADVGFTPDVVQAYVTNGHEEPVPYAIDADWPQHATDPPQPASPPGFKPDQWVLGFLCPRVHDYQGTGRSRYNKQMKCVDCEALRKRPKATRPPAREAPSG